MASTKHKGLPEVKESLVSVLHRLKEEGVPARIEGPQKGLGAALCPTCGQFGCTKDHEAEEQVEEGSAYGLWKGDGKVKLPGKRPLGTSGTTAPTKRHPRDQKELDRAQAYIKKNPKLR